MVSFDVKKHPSTMTTLQVPADTTTAFLSFSRTGDVRFLGQKVNFTDITQTDFSALNQIEALDLTISGSSGITVCDVQDAMFAVLGHFDKDHKLHTLNVSINVEMPEDAMSTMFTSNYAEQTHSTDTMREFRDIRPGQLSRPHFTAFLTDPIRTLRNLRKDGNKQPQFTLDFTGKSGNPWKDIRGQVFDLIQGDSPVLDYKVFSRYYDALRALFDFAVEHNLTDARKSKSQILPRMCGARVQGNVRDFRDRQNVLEEGFCKDVRGKIEERAVKSYQDAEEKEQQLREFYYLIDALGDSVPNADVDTSFFGYSLADEGLREWQTTGKAADKAAKELKKRDKEKRKREEETEEGGKSKKAKKTKA